MFKPSDVLEFWFGSKIGMIEINAEKSDLWWGKNSEIDKGIAKRFSSLVEIIHSGSQYDHWRNEPEGCLASILVLDQFPRNIYRGLPQSFSYDKAARDLAEHFLSCGFAQSLTLLQCVFAYLPYEHSEALKDQQHSVLLYQQLLHRADAEARGMFENFLDFAVRHRQIIEKFGRFPHRNEILGRHSSAEELDFLKQDGSSF